MADLIVDSAPQQMLFECFDKGVQQSALVDGIYEVEGFF